MLDIASRYVDKNARSTFIGRYSRDVGQIGKTVRSNLKLKFLTGTVLQKVLQIRLAKILSKVQSIRNPLSSQIDVSSLENVSHKHIAILNLA